MNPAPQIKRAANYDDIRPLVELCKAGKLFEVQQWIIDGKPVNPPSPPDKGRRGKSPLEVAVEVGFHSLVKVLLEAGAIDDGGRFGSLIYEVIRNRRFDLVQLFVENGFDPAAVDMVAVFESWDPQMMEYFVERGASLEEEDPFASAFCSRIRTALKLFMKYKQLNPKLQEQANIALRHHCKEGNIKWVSLMLWAGADPYAPGADSPGQKLSEGDEGTCALAYAALYNRFEVFDLKKIKLDPNHPQSKELMRYLDEGRGIEILEQLLRLGLDPNDTEAGGCSCFSSLLNRMSWSFSSWQFQRETANIDSERARDGMKAIHLLARHGAKWLPQTSEIGDARKSLLKLVPDYTVEFVWILRKYNATTLDVVEKLVSTPAMRRLLQRTEKAWRILGEWRQREANAPAAK